VRSSVLEMRFATPGGSFWSEWELPEPIRSGDRFKAEVGLSLEDARQGPIGIHIYAYFMLIASQMVLSAYLLSLMSFHHDGNFFGLFQQRTG
jgi:hypothetical protein